MNNRFRNLGTTVGLSAAALFLAAGTAFGADVPLATLNGGPSSDSIPANNANPVAFFVAPREIVDPTIANNLPIADLANNSLLVQDAADPTGTGVRNRSRAVMAVFDVNNNVPPFLILQANLGFDPLAADSYFLFLNTADAVNINTIGELDQFITTGTAGVDYVQVFFDNPGFTLGSNAGAYDDADITDLILNTGSVAVQASDFTTITPDGGGALGSAVSFELALVVWSDGAGPGADIPTEYMCLRNDPTRVAPTDAALDPANQIIRVVSSQPLVTDGDDTVATYDTDAAILNGEDFRVRTNGVGASTSLLDFLGGLTGSPAVAGVTITGDFNTIIEIALTAPIDPADENLVLNSTIGFASETANGRVYSFAGEDPNPDVNTFQSMDRAADLGFIASPLLQGTGQSGFGNGLLEVWVAVNFDDSIDVVGDADQFELINASGDVVAQSIAVQDTVPTNVQVLGIDDLNLDGNANDPVIETANNRLFARFLLNDVDDSVNSDATWSDNGQDSFHLEDRGERESLSIILTQGFAGTTAQTALGGTINPDSVGEITDLARPTAIGFYTRAGDTGEFCEFVDSLDLIYDETIVTNANTTTFSFLGYNSGEEISDLTTGLGAGLSIPTIDIVTTAVVNDRRLTPVSVNLGTNLVNNDTLVFGAPTVPVDGTANDGTTSILTGTGDEGYIIAQRNAAVADVNGMLSYGFGAFNGSDELTGGFEVVVDGAPPMLLGANILGDGFELIAGFSENVNYPGFLEEGESLFVIMENDAIGRRVNIKDSFLDGFSDNLIFLFLDEELDEDFLLDPGYNLSVFNPGYAIADDEGNESDPNATKTKLVLITPPAAAFKEEGIAIIDEETDKVVEIRLHVTGPVELNEDGDFGELAERFFLRGSNDNFNDGEPLELGGLIEDIEIDDEPAADGCYTVTLFLMEGMPFPQEDFWVEYADRSTLESPADSYLVTPSESGDIEIASANIYVSVLRPPSGDFPDGNPLTMTVVGTVNLGEANSLGSVVSAWIWHADAGLGVMSFTYKGVVHTTTIDQVAHGEVRYFHPQLLGDGLGAVDPMGIVNRKPELDITATVNLTRQGMEDGEIVDLEQETLVYQNLNPLSAPTIIRPIQITFRDDPTCPGRFTFSGSGISNGTVVYPGEFELIGETIVVGDVIGEDDEIGPRPYALHTRGNKDWNGRPVVIVVSPEEFFAPGIEPFLANNMLFPVDVSPNARAFTFNSDINRTGANALPMIFNIDYRNVTSFDIFDYEQDNWVILPIPTNQGDRGANLPNRVTANNTAVTQTGPISTAISARGGFVVLDDDFPAVLDIGLALALDSRGVFCGDICNLSRIVSGYAYALLISDFDDADYRWFTFGNRFVSPAFLAVTTNNTNGGWNLIANLRPSSVMPSSFGGQVNITMSHEEGVRVWANGFDATNDLHLIQPNQGVLVNTTSTFNSVP